MFECTENSLTSKWRTYLLLADRAVCLAALPAAFLQHLETKLLQFFARAAEKARRETHVLAGAAIGLSEADGHEDQEEGAGEPANHASFTRGRHVYTNDHVIRLRKINVNVA